MRLGGLRRILLVEAASLKQIVPGAVVLGRADPHIEVRRDPGTWGNRFEPPKVAVAIDRFGNGNGLHSGRALQAIVETAQEFAPGFGVILPGVFAIEDDGNHGIVAFIQHRLRRPLDVLDEVLRRFLRGHAGVHKSDQVRDGVIAEQQVHAGGTVFVAIDGVKLLSQMVCEKPISVAREKQARASSQNAFVGRHPAHAQAVGDGDRLVGDAAFRRPHPMGANAKDLFVQVEPARDLVPRIFRVAEAVLRQGQAGTGDGPHIGVTEQGQNGMVKG